MERQSANEFLSVLLDNKTFISWDRIMTTTAEQDGQVSGIYAVHRATGADESIITGEGRINGYRIAVIVSEFNFVGGSIGIVASDRIVQAFRRATEERLPVVAAPASGGTRMQEGAQAFVQILRITGAAVTHKSAGLLYLTYLRDPTTGGAFASWGSLGHLTFAEPGAVIGFMGPRVHQASYKSAIPTDVQRAENLYRHGIIDAVFEPEMLRSVITRILSILYRPRYSGKQLGRPTESQSVVTDPLSSWSCVEATRRPGRPGVTALINHIGENAVEINGTGNGERDSRIVTAIVELHGIAGVLIGQDGRPDPRPALGPAGYRQAQRAMRIAEQLRLPLITVIDTAGAMVSRRSEEDGLSHEIAQCIATMLSLDSVTVSVLLGQGAGGGALALLPADRVLAAKHSWLSPLPPEDASVLMFHTRERAAWMAEAQGIRAHDLLTIGMVDSIIDERPDASVEPVAFIERVASAAADALRAATESPFEDKLRHERLRSLGAFNT